MELCEYGDLDSYIEKTYEDKNKSNYDYIPVEDLEILIGQILTMCFFLHEKGIVHRDWKLNNILVKKVKPFVILRLTDFGYARANSAVMMTLSGTFATADPNILMGKNYTDRSELYSLGCILYRLIYHKYPFEGCNDEETIYNKVDKGEIEYPTIREEYQPLIDLTRKLISVDRRTILSSLNKGESVWNLFKSNTVVKKCLTKVKELFEKHYPDGKLD